MDQANQSSVFKLKMFRDNAEVHRLQQLKTFYEFHTEIEESCLAKYRNFCDHALGVMSKIIVDDESLPDYDQIMYFSLLDQWALWLDSKKAVISQCAKDFNKRSKEEIINSVEDFVNKHPIKNLESALNWITTPQALLIIAMRKLQNQKFAEANEIFFKLLKDEPEFAAEAHYYIAFLFLQQGESDLALKHFYKSRVLFALRIQRKQQEASLVAQIVEKNNNCISITSGFMEQQKTIINCLMFIITNIDNIIGTPCNPEMFISKEIDAKKAEVIFKALTMKGVISPALLVDHQLELWQTEVFRQKYIFSKMQIEVKICSIIFLNLKTNYRTCYKICK